MKVMETGVTELDGEMQRNFKLMLTLNKTTEADGAQGELDVGSHGVHDMAELLKNFKVEFPQLTELILGHGFVSVRSSSMLIQCPVKVRFLWRRFIWMKKLIRGFQAAIRPLGWNRFTKEIIADMMWLIAIPLMN